MCLLISNSYTGLCALTIAILYYFYKTKHKDLWLYFILSGLMCFYIDWQRLFYRFPNWLHTLKEILKSPFIGNGFDNTLSNNMILTKIGWAYRHNDYLNIARDLGLPFLIFLIFAILKFHS